VYNRLLVQCHLRPTWPPVLPLLQLLWVKLLTTAKKAGMAQSVWLDYGFLVGGRHLSSAQCWEELCGAPTGTGGSIPGGKSAEALSCPHLHLQSRLKRVELYLHPHCLNWISTFSLQYKGTRALLNDPIKADFSTNSRHSKHKKWPKELPITY
jgi:hypothetical protein